MSSTKIEWCDKVWNPVTGCDEIGQGCRHCYAKREFSRLAANPKAGKYFGRKFGDVMCHDDPDILYKPFHWKKPSEIFITSMGDLFHKDVPDAFIAEVVKVIGYATWHTFILLTKRPERMRGFFAGGAPRNLVLGVSASNQAEADRAVHELRATPAACRVVSLEPLLGPIRLDRMNDTGDLCSNSLSGKRVGKYVKDPDRVWNPLSGVIVGGESGPKARPMHPDWVRGVRDQCAAAGVPFFFKQWGEWLPKSQGAVATNGALWGCQEDGPDRESTVIRVGKRSAGRLLDGRTHDALPWRVGK